MASLFSLFGFNLLIFILRYTSLQRGARPLLRLRSEALVRFLVFLRSLLLTSLLVCVVTML